MSIVFGLIAVFALVFMNGFFVAAEFALVGARHTRIAQLAESGHTGARVAQKAIDHLDNYIAATQLGITLASLALGWIGEPAFAHLLEPVLDLVLPAKTVETVGHTIVIGVGFALVTMLHIVLGELAPKSIALQRPEATALIVSRPVTLFAHVFRPVIYVMNRVGNAVVRLLGFEPASGHERVHSAEELGMLVRSAHEAGLLEDREELLLQRVFDFSDIHIREVMQPRVEVEAIPIDIPLAQLLERVATGPYSRYPIFKDSIDKVVGILHTKDLLDLIVHNPDILDNRDAPLDVTPVLRTPLYFPAMASVDKVLEQMQRSQTHVTIVIDEFGGMAGIATMEDILEELVGEVQDEFDVEPEPVHIEADVAVFDGLVSLNDVIERFGEPGDEFHSATIGGYVAERLDRIPTTGDKVPFGPYDLYVDDMDEMRVARVRLIARKPEAAPSQNEPAAPPDGNKQAKPDQPAG